MDILSVLLICGSAPGAAVADIPADTVVEQFGQVQKIGLIRTKLNATTENSIDVSTNDPQLLVTWNSLKTATDSSRVQFTPELHAPNSEPGEAREYGGDDNSTAGGVTIILGRKPSKFECEMLNVRQDIIDAIQSYENEKQLSVFLINECGQIGGLTDSYSSPTTFKPIPIRSFFCSDKKFGGFDEPDKNMMKFQFLPRATKSFYVYTPTDFDALTQL